MADRRNHRPFSKKQQAAPKHQDVTQRFEKASAEMHQAVLKHIQTPESSSDEDDLEEDTILSAVMKDYSDHGKDSSKTREYLEQTFQSGAATCLICIGSIKRIHPIWNCNTCFSAFHLSCIQRWASSSIYQSSEAADPSLESSSTIVRVNKFKKIEWGCPKCRETYTQEDVPSKYVCFCKKKVDPEFQPWLIPHSCGAVCDKPLLPECGHRCLLLCHPGSCPPCPKMVNVKCYCGQSGAKPMRCSAAEWSCNGMCGKLLSCMSHVCQEKCHQGECFPCKRTSVQRCQCGKKESSRPCADVKWQCGNICAKPFECGFHICERQCHENDCGACPFTGNQKCPCGAVKMVVVCPEEVSSCGGTCNKILACGEHTCPNKCHKNACPPCIKLVDKTCRCGLHAKQMPCNKQYLCDTKCKIIKRCGRHACSKKCCDGNCLPCDKPCGKTLKCGKHKCPSVCHGGFCYPCPLSSRISCRCNATGYLVPCGSERKNRPPKCNKNCNIPAMCNHVNVHKCHFGGCPACEQRCNKSFACGHKCTARCHNAVPIVIPAPKPSGPWEIQQPKIEIKTLPCPPCTEKVMRPCLGGHEESPWNCCEARVTSCGRPCGRPLMCTNHTCSRECHTLVPNIATPSATDDAHKCENCNRSCEIPRPDGCKHPCKKGCHPAPCDDCQQFLKRMCHCGLTELYVRCFFLTTGTEQQKSELLSCKQQCSRSLECGHRCSNVCHPGVCISDCSKKTKVYCPCRRIKKDVPCNVVKQSEGLIQCNEVCEEKKREQLKIAQVLEEQRQKEEQERNQKEMEEYEKKFGKKKPREHRNRNKYVDEVKGNVFMRYKCITASVLIVFVAMLVTYMAL